MEIYMISNGETEKWATEYYDRERRVLSPPLSAQGREQAKILAARLAEWKFDRIYASDLHRAYDAATPLAQAQGQEVILDPAFREIDMGELNRRPRSEFPVWEAEFSRRERDIPYPGGETGGDVWKRVERQLLEIAKRPYERVAVFCHGGTIMSAACGAIGLPQQLRFRLGGDVENTSITILYRGDGWVLHSFNDYAHLRTP